MHIRRAGLFGFAVVSFVIFTSSLFAEGEADLQRNFILETHPISWYIWGANADVEINIGAPVSLMGEYQHYGSEGKLVQSDYFLEPMNKEVFNGNNFIAGIRYYPSYSSSGMDGLYLGLALDYLKIHYEIENEYESGMGDVSSIDKLNITAYGVRAGLGWRWVFSNHITIRCGFFGGYYFSVDESSSGYPSWSPESEENKDFDKEWAMILTGTYANIRGGLEFAIGLAF